MSTRRGRILSKPPAEEPPPEPLTEVRVYTHQRAEVLDHVPLRQDGPIQKMQKGDLYKKIKEVFFELPENWNKFKWPELRDVTACVFDRIQGQLLHWIPEVCIKHSWT